MKGYYYLHTESKDLIYKPAIVVDSDPEYFNSPFVQKVWQFDSEDRKDCWRIVLEGLSLGAGKHRVKELAEKWGMDNHKDTLAAMVNLRPATDILRDGLEKFIKLIFGLTFDEFTEKAKPIAKEMGMNVDA